MNKHGKNWFDFWDKENLFMDENMKKNAQIFIKNYESLFRFHKDDVVLDIGCGPGYLEEYLRDKVSEIHCLETSSYYLKVLRKKFNKSSNVHIHKLDRRKYTSLNFLKHDKFTKTLCISVVQYYKDIDDIKRLIKEIKKASKKGSLVLIADIIVNPSSFTDIKNMLRMSLKENYFFAAIKFLALARFSEYFEVRRKKGLLVIPKEKIQEIIKEMELSAQIFDTPLSLNTGRRHLLIRI